MAAADLIARLPDAKPRGPGKWSARCPAHDDKTPSLSVRELDDGRVLVHCFCGCSAHEIVTAVGLELDALFPPRPLQEGCPPVRRPFSAFDALMALDFEARLIEIVAGDILAGQAPTPDDMDRVRLARERISTALGVCRG